MHKRRYNFIITYMYTYIRKAGKRPPPCAILTIVLSNPHLWSSVVHVIVSRVVGNGNVKHATTVGAKSYKK